MRTDKSSLRTVLSFLRVGRIAYLLWFAPLAWLRRCRREGGPWQQWIDRKGRREMIAAAQTFSPFAASAPGAPEVCFLTGKKFWYQTAFCFASLNRHAGQNLVPVFLDDGSFDDAFCAEMRRVFPAARIVTGADSERALDVHLPVTKFPTLRSQRRTYLHLRKLTDAHVGHGGWRLVLDSDMLFFRRPDALLAWLAAPAQPIHMLDVQDAYGYPAATLAALAGRPVPNLVNVGVCGLNSDTIDWVRLESWAAQLLATHGTSYYLEQALVALLLAGQSAVRLPSVDYRLMPDEAECRRPTAALHHYVELSKRGYFRHAWRHIVPTTLS